jgi:hypothetical protein
MKGPAPRPIRDRFIEKIAKAPDAGCWIWTAHANGSGYGTLRIGSVLDGTRRTVRATEVAFSLFRGAVPSHLFICHRCDNPRCVNPQHLFLGTAADNAADKVAKGRQARGAKCRARNPVRGERRGHAKLTTEAVHIIRASPNRTGRSLAKEFGVCPQTISNVRHGRIWSHVE